MVMMLGLLFVVFGQKPTMSTRQLLDSAYQMDFQRAQEYLSQVPLEDTLYNYVQLTLGHLYFENEHPKEAISCLKNVIEYPIDSIDVNWVYAYLGDAHRLNEDYEEAISCYKHAMKVYPYSAYLSSTIGVCYYAQQKYIEAEKYLEKAIFCNPFEGNYHYQLALAYWAQQKTIPGILAANFALFLNNEKEDILVMLAALYELGTDDFLQHFSGFDEDYLLDEYMENENFRYIESLIDGESKPENFRYRGKIKHKIPYYNQLVFENLKIEDKEKNIVNSFYIPMFQYIVHNDYDKFCLYQMLNADLNNKKLPIKQSVVKSIRKLIAQCNSLIQNGFMVLEEMPEAKFFEYVYEGKISAFGENIIMRNQEQNSYDGKWTVLNEKGQIVGEVELRDGLYNGVYKLYNQGVLSECMQMKDNVVEGESLLYYPQLPLRVHKKRTILEDNKELTTTFNQYGIVEEKTIQCEDDKTEFILRYSPQGVLVDSLFYKNGEHVYHYGFYPNGNVGILFNDILQNFYSNGKKHFDGNWNGEFLVDYYKSYHCNGNLKMVGSFNDVGQQEGYWVSYFRNGNIYTENNYLNHLAKEEVVYYAPSQYKQYMAIVSGDRLDEVVTYNKNGSVREHKKKIDGVLDVDIYNGYDLKLAHYYQNDSTHVDSTLSYYDNGNRYGLEVVTDSSQSKIHYYFDGTISNITLQKGNYEETKRYHPNGELAECYKSINGRPFGKTCKYNIHGQLLSEAIYNADGTMIKYNDYFPNGKINKSFVFKFGNTQIHQCFKPTGEMITSDTIKNGMGMFRYFSSGLNSENLLVAGEKHGWQKLYDNKGYLIDSLLFINGEEDGRMVGYYPNGEVFNSCTVSLGKVDGWHHLFSQEGVLILKSYFELDEIQDTMWSYDYEGRVKEQSCFVDGMLEGINSYYAPDGSVMLQVLYDQGYHIDYAYREKNGELSTFIPFTNDSLSIVSYYPNGEVALQAVFNQRRLISMQTYHKNGTLHQQYTRQNGFLHGEYIENFENGNLHVKRYYQYGELDGKTAYFYPNGNKRIEANYVGGNLYGTYIIYDEQGNITFQQDVY